MTSKNKKSIEEYIGKLPACEDVECKHYELTECQIEYAIDLLEKYQTNVEKSLDNGKMATYAAKVAIKLCEEIVEDYNNRMKRIKDIFDRHPLQ